MVALEVVTAAAETHTAALKEDTVAALVEDMEEVAPKGATVAAPVEDTAETRTVEGAPKEVMAVALEATVVALAAEIPTEVVTPLTVEVATGAALVEDTVETPTVEDALKEDMAVALEATVAALVEDTAETPTAEATPLTVEVAMAVAPAEAMAETMTSIPQFRTPNPTTAAAVETTATFSALLCRS